MYSGFHPHVGRAAAAWYRFWAAFPYPARQPTGFMLSQFPMKSRYRGNPLRDKTSAVHSRSLTLSPITRRAVITATRHSTLPPGVKASTAPCIGYGSGWSAWRPSGRHKARPIAAIRYVDSYQVKEAGAHRGRATLALANLAGLNCLDLVGVDADCHKQGKGGGLLRQSLDCLAFFTYLYGISILFLLYVFCYLLSGSARERKPKKPQKVRQPEGVPDGSPTQEKLTSSSSCSKPRKHKTSDNEHSHGSFFLRIGAIAFGLGTMIYNGLEFGVFFEIPTSSPCYQILRGVNPLLQLVFTFMQMYFVFMNARLNIHKFKFLARFGLMHIVATNLCVWVRTLVRESLKEINEFKVSQGQRGEDYMILEGIRRALANRGLLAPNRYLYNLDEFVEMQEINETLQQESSWVTEEDIVNRTCGRVEIMGSIVSDSAPYLYPFIVEYSLIGASVLYIMWKHIGRNPRFVYDPEVAGDGMSVVSRRCHSRVDCVGASKGLFCGLLVLVASLICLILFFVLVNRDELKMLAIYLADCSHCGIMFFSIIAMFIGFFRVRQLKFHGEREEELDDILLMVSAFGLFAYAVFSAVAGSLSAYTKEPNLLVMVTGILSVLQVIIQMVFIKDTQRRQVSLPEHERTKPGRQVVTFLLICNLTMWVIYTFETQKVEANPVQLEFFGDLPWTILLRCTLPLAIFHRFHSTVVLAAIWKNSYKTRIE
ncbi:hypothetical protein C7M84_005295 [Penaeus vannamei]|uniref:Otopetrin-2 n=1 Tax=Penaeus vannamei TaxID=6689 RepID=A0A423TI22_PENVA|nr:hypothetical protein C7M84_005295 [Penaeus vannamei]